jgi:hypothetical protein
VQFQHHDGDDDGDDAVAEGGETIFSHAKAPALYARRDRQNSDQAAGPKQSMRTG